MKRGGERAFRWHINGTVLTQNVKTVVLRYKRDLQFGYLVGRGSPMGRGPVVKRIRLKWIELGFGEALVKVIRVS